MAGNIKIDKELVDSILVNNNQKAYAVLLNKYKNSVYYTILKMVNNADDAEDLTMKTFTKAFQNLNSYDDNYAFTTWLFRIATNTTIDFIRKKRLQTSSLDDNVFDDEEGGVTHAERVVAHSLDPEEKYVKQQRSKIIREVIDTMDDKYKILIQAYFFDELKYEEISERYDLPLGTVKVRLKRAKEFLYKLLEDKQHKY